jgi:hypothetical protein
VKLVFTAIFILGDTDGQIAMITDFKAGTPREVVVTGPTAALSPGQSMQQ